MKNNVAKASVRMLKVGHRKLALVANLIHGTHVSNALKQLLFSRKKRVALEVKKCLDSAISNAENNLGMDIDKLIVKTITVGKSLSLKRFAARGRGKSSSIHKKFSNLYITLEEKF
jgi:large subunit ribosomal protein L22